MWILMAEEGRKAILLCAGIISALSDLRQTGKWVEEGSDKKKGVWYFRLKKKGEGVETGWIADYRGEGGKLYSEEDEGKN